MRGPGGSGEGARGQALPLVVLALVVGVGAVAVTAQVGRAVLEREMARHAADATALAGAVGGEQAAAAVATANGVALTAFAQVGDQITVSVRRGRFSVSARAERRVEVAGPSRGAGSGPAGEGAADGPPG